MASGEYGGIAVIQLAGQWSARKKKEMAAKRQKPMAEVVNECASAPLPPRVPEVGQWVRVFFIPEGAADGLVTEVDADSGDCEALFLVDSRKQTFAARDIIAYGESVEAPRF